MIVCKVIGDRSVTITEERELPMATGTELVELGRHPDQGPL